MYVKIFQFYRQRRRYKEMFSREKMTYQPSTSTLNCPVLEGSFLICTTSCKSNEYGAKKLRFASFPTNRWNIEKLRYDFIWINILYKNKIAFHKVSYKLPANTDLFISEQCLSKWQLFLVINNTGKCKSQQNLIFPGKGICPISQTEGGGQNTMCYFKH